MNLDIIDFKGEGYSPLVSFNGWRVAVINACDRFLEENLYRVERHMKTDEVFILLEGEATLYIGKDMQRVDMEMGKFYNVKCAEWHAISTKPGAKVAIVENDDTGLENTEYYQFK